MRKQLKMKVSLSRKIHIIAFFQDTCLKARWSEDQSATMPRQPGGRGRAGREAEEISAMLSYLRSGDRGRC